MRYIPVLTIAGSDSSGGAGIQADIKTISALGCYAASAITAVTVQNTTGVMAVHAVPPEIVEGQIRAVMDDIHPLAVKIGMVGDEATIRAVSRALRGYIDNGSLHHLVIDPVMVSTSCSRLMQENAIAAFKSELMPMATLLTPNMPEAEVLSGVKLSEGNYSPTDNQSSFDERFDMAGGKIACEAASAVLIKGGHSNVGNEKIDRLYDSEGTPMQTFTAESVATKNTHGTGCSLSSAIASMLARGMAVPDAIAYAKQWLTDALKAGADVEIGSGNGPVNHFFNPQIMIIK